MADVFVIGVFLAFLATESQVQENRFQVEALGAQLEVGIVTRVTSTLGPGFLLFSRLLHLLDLLDPGAEAAADVAGQCQRRERRR